MSRPPHLDTLRVASPVVLPSLLLCDFGNLEREVDRLVTAGVKGLHLDVMDGVFVPNFTYGLTIVEAFRKLTDLPLDVHLMMVEPQRYLSRFRDAGADILTIHVEAVSDPIPILEDIREMGLGAGLAINPLNAVFNRRKCTACLRLAACYERAGRFWRASVQPRRPGSAASRPRTCGRAIIAGGGRRGE